MQSQIKTIEMIAQWNQSKEQIMAFVKRTHQTFIITVQEMPVIDVYDSQHTEDFRQEIVFRSYILEQCTTDGFTHSIGNMRCFVHYRNDYDKLLRDYLYICDFSITGTECGKGYGSLMIQYVKNYAQNNKLEYIKGWLSESDISPLMGNRKDMLYHFYRKNGFIIDGNSIYCSLL